MTKLLNFTLLFFFPLIVSGQYDFEKYPLINHNTWHCDIFRETDEKEEISREIPKFFKNGEPLIIQLTSFKQHWFENSLISISQKNNIIQQFSEDVPFNIRVMEGFKVADYNGDGLNDLKIVATRVIYLYQQPNNSLLKISFDTLRNENIYERDFDEDGNHEIITMNLLSFENHNYYYFNLFNFVDGKLISVNKKYNYPIVFEYLGQKFVKVNEKIDPEKMKIFELSVPNGYKSER